MKNISFWIGSYSAINSFAIFRYQGKLSDRGIKLKRFVFRLTKRHYQHDEQIKKHKW